MKTLYFSFFSFLLFFFTGTTSAIKLTKSKANNNEIKKEKIPQLNSDLLPPLEDLLNELDLIHRKSALIKMGVTETRYLLRLKNMDYQMMLIEWDGDNVEEEINKMKLKSQELIQLATVVEKVESEVDNERIKLRTGRVYFPYFVQSFEYISAAFGTSPPVGPLSVYIPEIVDGCTAPSQLLVPHYQNKLVIIQRGNCTFLEKAQHAFHAGAKVLAIINSEDKIEAVASGLGIDPNITAAMVTPLDKFPIISLSNTSLHSIFSAYAKLSSSLEGAIVPLKCMAGSTCLPVLQEEKQYQTEVTWGDLTVSIGNIPTIRTQFLTSTFGGYLPRDLIILDLSLLFHQFSNIDASNDNACSKIPVEISQYIGKIQATLTQPIALMVKRGGCRFDQKAYNLEMMKNDGLIQPLSLMIIYDIHDEPLQRLGGLHPTDGYLSIPAIMIPFRTAELIQAALKNYKVDTSSAPITASISSSYSTNGFSDWVDIALTTWEDQDENQLLQLEGLKLKYSREASKGFESQDSIERDDLLAWLERRKRKLEMKLLRKDEL